MPAFLLVLARRKCVAEIEGDYPFPIRQTSIPKHLTRSIPEDPTALCLSPQLYSPPGSKRFVANKDLSAIQPSGDRTVEALFYQFSSQLLGGCHSLSAAHGFQRSLRSLHPEALLDFSRFEAANQERIEGICKALVTISVCWPCCQRRGIPLRFISYRRISLFVLASVGVLLNVSQQTSNRGRKRQSRFGLKTYRLSPVFPGSMKPA